MRPDPGLVASLRFQDLEKDFNPRKESWNPSAPSPCSRWPIQVFTIPDPAVHDAPIWVFTITEIRSQNLMGSIGHDMAAIGDILKNGLPLQKNIAGHDRRRAGRRLVQAHRVAQPRAGAV